MQFPMSPAMGMALVLALLFILTGSAQNIAAAGSAGPAARQRGLGHIPKNPELWQTSKGQDLPPAVVALRQTWTTKNPGITMHLHTDDQARQFMNESFGSEVLSTYNAFPVGAMRADFWRYAILYAYGGIYSDIDTSCQQPVAEWLPPRDGAAAGLAMEFLYNSSTTWPKCRMIIGLENSVHFCQWTIVGIPKHPVLRTVINMIVERARAAGKIDAAYARANRHFVHMHTGPSVWTEAIKSYLLATVKDISEHSRVMLGKEAGDVFKAVHSDPALYRQVRQLGLCFVGSSFMNSRNVMNLFGSKWSEFKDKQGWEGYPSWLEEKRDLTGAGSIWTKKKQRLMD